ncbi:MAG: DNA topoisomerase (ATP-hydrolyzing) subunit A, partial [Campylobacterota bacterium]
MSDLLNNDDIQTINIEETLQDSYLDYSMSVIVGRALPDVRDGLKPVHRRILYAMDKLNLSHGSKFKKSARIVGDVIGQYHPHGDTAVYDALVRMAQDFSMRMELVDGQGNFGSVDGDSAAAMRYTEARMTKYAGELLKDLDKNTVNMIENYDGTTKEPDVMPTRAPNLLINGSSGIAVGMATNIPPHNPSEIMSGLKALLANPNITLQEIMEHIKAPDFPTGGIIYGKKGITEAYESGRGRIKVRAKTHIEQQGKKEIIVIDELPYQVNKSRLIENIANLVKDKMIDGVSLIRDESDREGMRVVIELKRDAMSEIVLNNLFKQTSMQTTFGIIMLSILNQEPRIFGIIDVLKHFINHRKTVIIRRTIFDLEKAKARAHILEGLKKAIDIIEKVIKTIRASGSEEDAKNNLVSEYDFSEIQASSIVAMRLGRLTGLEIEKIENELAELMTLIEYLESILKSEDVLHGIIGEEFDEVAATYTDKRRTDIEDDYDDIDIEDLIPNEPMVVTITHRGYIKRVPLANYEKQKRGGKGKTAVTTYEDDFIESFFTCNTHDTLLFVTDRGQLHCRSLRRPDPHGPGDPVAAGRRRRGGYPLHLQCPGQRLSSAGVRVGESPRRDGHRSLDRNDHLDAHGHRGLSDRDHRDRGVANLGQQPGERQLAGRHGSGRHHPGSRGGGARSGGDGARARESVGGGDRGRHGAGGAPRYHREGARTTAGQAYGTVRFALERDGDGTLVTVGPRYTL